MKLSVFRKSVRVSIVVIYLIIVAGAVVRMTGAGMGCPDWPKCFGYYIPPTDRAQLDFYPNFDYNKDMVIIVNEELRVAKEDFTSSDSYNENNWEAYTKHDYAVFDVYHTWTEYINRLFGALGGLAVLVTFVFSIFFVKKKPTLFILSGVALVAMLVQAVIGKIVIDTLLSPVLITIHMIVALLIVGVLIYILHLTKSVDQRYTAPKKYPKMALWIIALTLVQVGLGTQVRQYLDDQVDALGYPFLSQWLDPHGPVVFYVHRSFSILLLAIHAYFIYHCVHRLKHPSFYYNLLAVLILVTIFTGVLMNYFDFPLSTQAIHLVFSSFILGVQFSIWIRLYKVHRPERL